MAEHLKPGAKVGLKLTAAQRKLLLDLICLDDDYAEVVRDTPGDQPVQLTLDQWRMGQQTHERESAITGAGHGIPIRRSSCLPAGKRKP